MKILLTGGGSGGHFYPLVAVAEAINKIAKEENLILPEIFFMSDHPYDMESLVENNISFVSIPAGKIRRYFSLANFFDVFKIFLGIIIAFKKVFSLYPDIVFSKGAYVSFPVLLAARLLKIPIIIHESDSVPGRTNLWASKFAKKIAVSYPDTAKYFADQSKVAFTGNPLRKAVLNVNKNGAHEYLNLEKDITTILIIGGSLGAQIINERILDALPKLVEKYQILHQTGKNNFSEVNKTSEVILLNNVNKSRYHSFDYLNDLTLIAQMLIPFLPETAKKIQKALETKERVILFERIR